jgi:hypothetical protein
MQRLDLVSVVAIVGREGLLVSPVKVVPKSSPMTNRVSSISRAVETCIPGDVACATETDERLVDIDGGGGGRGRSMMSEQDCICSLLCMTSGVCSSYRYVHVLRPG